MFAPAQATIDTVKEWLTDFGIDATRITNSDNKGWLAFDATASEAEALLHAKYHYYEDAEGYLTPACESYHVPRDIQEHIDYITPGVKLLAPRKRAHDKRRVAISSSQGDATIAPLKVLYPPDLNITAAGELATCDKSITPACIRALYDIPETPEYPNGNPRSDNSLGIFEEGDFYAQADLDLYFSSFAPRIPTGTHPTLASIDGGKAPVPVFEAGESDLDLEIAYPLIYPQKITLYQTDDRQYAQSGPGIPKGGFNTFLDALDGSYCTYSAFGETGNDPSLDPKYPDTLDSGEDAYKGQLQCGIYKPTNVISVSYSDQEADLPAYYQQRQCNEFVKLGLQGVSIFHASGDYGVGGPSWHMNESDLSESGCIGANYTVFSPTWPNRQAGISSSITQANCLPSCPYLTNVGATKVYPGKTTKDSESAAVNLVDVFGRVFASGGGFSNLYPIPDYQKDAVADFYKNHNPKYPYYTTGVVGQGGGLYNRSGRGYPDVAANGDHIAVFQAGSLLPVSGTSASTPIFASIVNRINEQRLNAGKNVIGFINPALYANPSMLNDITSGNNPGCGTEGFQAVPGWDPVTGLGTPNYPKMVSYFMSLP
ncbi:Aorsin [Lachnellula arida]|uniref:Aorsin n=1 Tax=Lachnellula arida TaxID=1316785 RepID=A0A8T9BPX7_9HELO|nr:Aorsin [Lachnellula arida]